MATNSVSASNTRAASDAAAAVQQSQQQRRQERARPVPPVPEPVRAASQDASQQTRATQNAGQADRARQTGEAAFLSRQQLDSKASGSPPPSLGKHIDTTA
ncbi:MAG TPA: hypothetical protein VFG03_18130 [Telluria sp.]|nr:hypothetical protein [Telluria sp.]